MKYQKPEIIDLSGLDAFGECNSGSGDTTCTGVGNNATGACTGDGNDAGTQCQNGIAGDGGMFVGP